MWCRYRPVEIHDHKQADDSLRTYTAKCPCECRDTVDREAYELAIQHNETISLGSVIATPISHTQRS
jgi:hypothetical protein